MENELQPITFEYHQLTQEEIGSNISIPNKEGSFDIYGDIYTFEDLYSVLEDLSVNYQDLLDEKHYLEGEIDDLQDEIDYLEEKIESFEISENGYIQQIENYKNDNDFPICTFFIIIIISYYIFYKILSKNK